MNECYELYCGRQPHGCFPRLAEALTAAVAIAGQSWRDLVVRSGTEAVAVIQAGGDVIELAPGRIETTASAENGAA